MLSNTSALLRLQQTFGSTADPIQVWKPPLCVTLWMPRRFYKTPHWNHSVNIAVLWWIQMPMFRLDGSNYSAVTCRCLLIFLCNLDGFFFFASGCTKKSSAGSCSWELVQASSLRLLWSLEVSTWVLTDFLMAAQKWISHPHLHSIWTGIVQFFCDANIHTHKNLLLSVISKLSVLHVTCDLNRGHSDTVAPGCFFAWFTWDRMKSQMRNLDPEQTFTHLERRWFITGIM